MLACLAFTALQVLISSQPSPFFSAPFIVDDSSDSSVFLGEQFANQFQEGLEAKSEPLFSMSGYEKVSQSGLIGMSPDTNQGLLADIFQSFKLPPVYTTRCSMDPSQRHLMITTLSFSLEISKTLISSMYLAVTTNRRGAFHLVETRSKLR